jgi:hypothetical protein
VLTRLVDRELKIPRIAYAAPPAGSLLSECAAASRPTASVHHSCEGEMPPALPGWSFRTRMPHARRAAGHQKIGLSAYERADPGASYFIRM